MPKLRRTTTKRRRVDSVAAAAAGGIEVVNPNSRLLESEIMNMFSIPPTFSPVIQWVRNISYYPISVLDDNNNTIEFYISPSATELIRPSGILMEVKVAVQEAVSGDALDANGIKEIGLNHLGMYSLFSNQQVSINEIVVDDSNNLHTHRCAVDMLLHRSRKEYDNELKLAGVQINDPPEKFDNIAEKTNKAQNAYYQPRAVAPFTWIGKLNTGICKLHNSELLPTNTSLRFKFTRAPKNQILITSEANKEKYKVVIQSCRLIIPNIRLDDHTAMAIESALSQRNIHYKIERYSSSYMTIDKNLQTNVLNGFHIGLTPLFTVVTMLDSDRFTGKATENPNVYNCKDLKMLKVCSEEESEYREPLRLEAGNYTEPMLALLRGTNRFGNHWAPSMIITEENFKHGLSLLFFSHLPDPEVRMDAFHALKRGNMRFQIEWTAPENKAITVVFHMMYLSDLQITGDRRVLYEYN